MNSPCALCNKVTGSEVILVVLPSAGRFWFCSLGCLVSWAERQMLTTTTTAEGADR